MSGSLLHDKNDPVGSIDLLGRLAFFAETSDNEEQKSEMLWDLTDYFFETAETCSQGDRDFLGELMEDIAFSLETKLREALARKIAAEVHAPHRLVVRLANDEIPVARPVLESSPVLTDDDLVDISRNKGQGHLLVITKRDALSYRLTTVLAERGDNTVVASLLQNPKAKISCETMTMVLDREDAPEPMQAEFVRRSDVPQEVLLDLLKDASATVKREVERKLTAADQTYLDEVVDSVKSEFDTSKQSLAKKHIDSLLRRNALNEVTLLRFVRQKEPMKFLLGFAALIAADVNLARKVMGDPTGQMLVVACRACKISFDGLKEIASSPMTAMSFGITEFLDLSKSYKRINEEDAKEMLRALKLRQKMISS